MFEKTKQFCDSLLDLGAPGFDFAFYKDGECILRYMNGYSDFENKIKMTGKEKFNLYSCSKVITCTAALQLWEKGMFSLEDKLSAYMPEFENMTVQTESGIVKAENPILIKHLFEMTAGFSYIMTAPALLRCKEETGGVCQTREAMRYLAQEPLSFEPGDRFQYSLCHDVLAALVEVLSGEKFEDYVKRNIFDVLGMKDSTFLLPESELDTVAAQYRYADGKLENAGKQIIAYKLGSAYASGGAGCIATVDDYIRFAEGLRTYKLLTPETVELMYTDRLTEYQKRDGFWIKPSGYGLGVRCSKDGRGDIDFGWGGAAGANLSIDIKNGLSCYYGSHVLGAPAQGPRSMLFRMAKSELLQLDDWDEIEEKLKGLYEAYGLTY